MPDIPPTVWCRLSNGVIEKKAGVGEILLVLRDLAVNSKVQFEFLAHYVIGKMDDLPDYLVAKLKKANFVKEDSDPMELYDDVLDVIKCCSNWNENGTKVRFDSNKLMHPDQTNIVPPDEDEGEEQEEEVA